MALLTPIHVYLREMADKKGANANDSGDSYDASGWVDGDGEMISDSLSLFHDVVAPSAPMAVIDK